MKTIGQFAKEHNVTVKTLHHYEKLELIKPMKVDAYTGYRYYGDNESQDLRIVLFLKQLGFSLSEIKNIINESFDIVSLKEFLIQKQTQANNDKINAFTRFHKISSIIDVINTNQDAKINYKELISMGEKQLYTGKYGRGQFIDASEKLFFKAKNEKTDLCVIQLDIDDFHRINQQFGYEVGDVILDRTTSEIISLIQEIDLKAMLERKGGDEYSIIVEASQENTISLAKKIIDNVKKVDYSDVAEQLYVSITAGVAALNEGTKTYSQLIQDATVILYETKRSGEKGTVGR